MRLVSHLLCAILALTLVLSHAQDDQTQFLDAHNKARAEVGVAPLVWNHTLELYAKNITDHLKDTCVNHGSSTSPYGENSGGGYGVDSIVTGVNKWVGEKVNYDHNSNVCVNGAECKHYTQVIWKDTTSVGCSITKCGAGWHYVVCEYYPPGNVPGKWPY